MYHSVEYVDNGEIFACVGAEGVSEISVPPAQFCCKPKITF